MATGIHSSGTMARLVEEGLHGLWGDALKRYDFEAGPVFNRMKSRKEYEDVQGIYGLGLAPQKNEGDAYIIDNGGSALSKRFTHITYATGVQITEEAVEDNLYLNLSKYYAKEIAKALRETEENVAANILNRAFNSSYTGADGLELCSTAHLYKAGGTYSNELATPAALSEASLENQIIAVDKFKDDRQLPRKVQSQLLIVPPDLRFTACRILKSPLQNDTANNAVNALRDEGEAARLRPHVMRRLTSTTAHFIKTDVEKGLMMFERVAPAFNSTVDFDTNNIKMKGRMRISYGWVDPQGIHGNSGA